MRRIAAKVPTASAILLLALAPGALGQAGKKQPAAAAKPAPARTLDRVRETGTLRLGYRTDARPFSFEDAGKPAGYSVELCQTIGEAVKSEVNRSDLKVEWVAVTVENQVQAVQQHQIDVLCASTSVTLKRREQVDFSIPVFPGGVGVVVRSDSPKQLRNILNGEARKYTPTWKAVALNVLREQVFVAIPGTTAEQWIQQRGEKFQVEFTVNPVTSYEAGVQAVLDRKASAFFGERAVLLDAVRHHPSGDDLMVLERYFTNERLALPIQREDDDFRLLTDRTLSKFYTSAGYESTYTKWFGEPDETAETFFQWNALPE